MSEPARENESVLVHNTRAAMGWAPFLGCVAVGLIGIAGAVLGMEKSDGRFNGGGIYLVGAAIAFGMLVNAILRK
jgi:hypothetical protein